MVAGMERPRTGSHLVVVGAGIVGASIAYHCPAGVVLIGALEPALAGCRLERFRSR